MIKPLTSITMTNLANDVNFQTKTWANFSKMIKAIMYFNILPGLVLTISPGMNIDFN
jgi:hypothetical protein